MSGLSGLRSLIELSCRLVRLALRSGRRGLSTLIVLVSRARLRGLIGCRRLGGLTELRGLIVRIPHIGLHLSPLSLHPIGLHSPILRRVLRSRQTGSTHRLTPHFAAHLPSHRILRSSVLSLLLLLRCSISTLHSSARILRSPSRTARWSVGGRMIHSSRSRRPRKLLALIHVDAVRYELWLRLRGWRRTVRWRERDRLRRNHISLCFSRRRRRRKRSALSFLARRRGGKRASVHLWGWRGVRRRVGLCAIFVIVNVKIIVLMPFEREKLGQI